MTDDNKTRPRRRRSPAPTTPDPIEIAMEAEAADESENSPARRVLLKHEQLLGWQILKERAGFGLRVLTGVVGLVAAVLVGSLVWSASHERGMVIEPFSVPPEFAQRGVTGQVVASRLLDRLSEMSDQTQSIRAPSTYANNWNGDIKVQIPQTGVSVGELRRYLVEWLGHQTTIGGELYRTPDGLSLIARTGTATASPQTGTDERDLDAMIQAAAEQVYAKTQPYRYAIYVGRQGSPEAVARSAAALRDLTRTRDVADRTWAYAALNLRLQYTGDYRGAIAATDAAIAIAPDFAVAYANRAGARQALGYDEAAYQDMLTAARLLRSKGRRYLQEEGLAFSVSYFEGEQLRSLGDYAGASQAYERALAILTNDEAGTMFLTSALAGQHDVAAARQVYARVPPPAPGTYARISGLVGRERPIARADIAYAAEDWPEIVRTVGAVDGTRINAAERLMLLTFSYPQLAIALVKTGDTPRAIRIAASTPTDCYRCVIARAVVAEASGDRATADRWFAEAIRQGPSLPFAHEARGRARLARGNRDGALADFREANRRSPNWADPLKGWGDVLMAQGDTRQALRRYEAAQERAPQWSALRQAIHRARQP